MEIIIIHQTYTQLSQHANIPSSLVWLILFFKIKKIIVRLMDLHQVLAGKTKWEFVREILFRINHFLNSWTKHTIFPSYRDTSKTSFPLYMSVHYIFRFVHPCKVDGQALHLISSVVGSAMMWNGWIKMEKTILGWVVGTLCFLNRTLWNTTSLCFFIQKHMKLYHVFSETTIWKFHDRVKGGGESSGYLIRNSRKIANLRVHQK